LTFLLIKKKLIFQRLLVEGKII